MTAEEIELKVLLERMDEQCDEALDLVKAVRGQRELSVYVSEDIHEASQLLYSARRQLFPKVTI